jgi:aarF domain-containing kinase
VILETFEEGRIVTGILDEYDSKGRSMNLQGSDVIPVDKAKFLVTTGVSMYLKMLLLDNLMVSARYKHRQSHGFSHFLAHHFYFTVDQHADLHPGNIMLREMDDSNGKKKYQITLVDAGMVAQLTEAESSTFIGMLTCIGEGDGEAAAEFALRFSIGNDLSEMESMQFKKDMVEFFGKNCRGYGTNVDVGEVFRGILGLIREHRIRIDANYATLVINVLCIEGLGRRICPSYNVLDAARPLLQTYRRFVYQDDGYTPKSKSTYAKRVKQLMPIMLYHSKKRSDNVFFKQVEATRRTRIAGGAHTEPKSTCT